MDDGSLWEKKKKKKKVYIESNYYIVIFGRCGGMMCVRDKCTFCRTWSVRIFKKEGVCIIVRNLY